MAHARYLSKHITSSATTTPISASCYVSSIVASCSNAGTSWTLQIQDKASTPNVLISPFTLIVPADGLPNINVAYDRPQRAVDGIDIITAGTAGVVDVQIGCQTIDA
jgi:hypothetical protein